MAFLVFFLSLALLVAGVASAALSLDLVPTGVGVLYAMGGAVGVSMAILAFALGVVIRRIDALATLMQASAAAAADARSAEESPEPPLLETEAIVVEEDASGEPLPAEGEEAIGESCDSRAAPGEIERAIEPQAPPSLVGRYSSGDANYMIFNDGSIEAELREGTYKFASMGDFKTYLADRKGQSA